MLKRRDLSWLWFLLVGALVGLYGVYWKIVHDQAIVIMGDEVEGWRAAGYDITWSEMSSGGFPFNVEAVFTDPAVTSPPDGEPWSWRGETLRVAVRPWALTTLTVRPEGAHSVTTQDYGVVDAEASDVVVSVHSDAQGLRAADVMTGHVAAVRRVSGETLFAAESVAARVERLPEDAGLYQLAGDVRRPEWTDSNGAAPDEAIVQAALNKTDVLAAQRDLDARAIAAWANAGGRIVVSDARLTWPDAEFGLSADLTVARNGHWDGQVLLDLKPTTKVIAKFIELGLVEARDAQPLTDLLARASSDVDLDDLPITIRDGQARWIAFRVADVPRAY